MQVGLEDSAKSEKKSIGKRIEKNMNKKMPFGSAWRGDSSGAPLRGVDPGTP